MSDHESPFWALRGPAHTPVLVVRAGPRPNASFEVLPRSAALGCLRRWVVDPVAKSTLLEIHRTLFGGLATSGWALSDVVQLLESDLTRAIERGDLLLLEPKLRGFVAGTEEPTPATIPGSFPGVPTEGTAYIEIELLDQASLRFPTRLRFTPPASGAASSAFEGFVRIEGLPPGICAIEFPEVDGREWGVAPAGPGSGLRTGFDHVALQGECISSISRRFGFASWRTVYDDPKNEKLRAIRPNPNELAQGDVVFVPDHDPRVEESATNRRATYRTLALPTRLRIKFEGQNPNDYELRVGGQTFKGHVGPGGMIDEAIPGDATAAELIMRPTHLPEVEDRWVVSLGELDPISELTGIQARLDNLGFTCPVDGTEGEQTKRAVRAYQRWRGIGDGQGTLDAATRSDLRSFHDG